MTRLSPTQRRILERLAPDGEFGRGSNIGEGYSFKDFNKMNANTFHALWKMRLVEAYATGSRSHETPTCPFDPKAQWWETRYRITDAGRKALKEVTR